MDKLSTRKVKTNLTKRKSKPDNDELLATFTRKLVDELNRSSNKCMQEYKKLIKSRWNARNSVYRFHTKVKKFKKPSAMGKYTIMSTITEERSLENVINETTRCYSSFSKKNTTGTTSKPQQKTKFTESHQTKEKKTDISDVPQQRLQRPSEKTSMNKAIPYYKETQVKLARKSYNEPKA